MPASADTHSTGRCSAPERLVAEGDAISSSPASHPASVRRSEVEGRLGREEAILHRDGQQARSAHVAGPGKPGAPIPLPLAEWLGRSALADLVVQARPPGRLVFQRGPGRSGGHQRGDRLRADAEARRSRRAGRRHGAIQSRPLEGTMGRPWNGGPSRRPEGAGLCVPRPGSSRSIFGYAGRPSMARGAGVHCSITIRPKVTVWWRTSPCANSSSGGS